MCYMEANGSREECVGSHLIGNTKGCELSCGYWELILIYKNC